MFTSFTSSTHAHSKTGTRNSRFEFLNRPESLHFLAYGQGKSERRERDCPTTPAHYRLAATFRRYPFILLDQALRKLQYEGKVTFLTILRDEPDSGVIDLGPSENHQRTRPGLNRDSSFAQWTELQVRAPHALTILVKAWEYSKRNEPPARKTVLNLRKNQNNSIFLIK